MKSKLLLVLLSTLTFSSFSYADSTSDDNKWIAQCQKDNAKEGAKPDVVFKYCSCMNDKMSDKETKSITEWEKTHPNERKSCEKEAEWK